MTKEMKVLILLLSILNGLILLTPVLGSGSCDPDGCTADDCPAPYTLRECEDLLGTNECLSNPCQNRASCEDLFDQFECICRRGFTGERCQNDNEKPMITCPPNQVHLLNDADTKVIHWDQPTVSDNAGNATVTISDSRPRSGSTFSAGDTAIVYTATDAAGNMNTCSFSIHLDRAQECESSPCQNGATCEVAFDVITCFCTRGFDGNRCEHDTEPPAILCPDNIFAETSSKNAKVPVTWHSPTTSDNSGKTPKISSSLHQSGDKFPIGKTPVTFDVSDDANNINRCTFYVTVEYVIGAKGFTNERKGQGNFLHIGLPICIICGVVIVVALAYFIYRRTIRKRSDDGIATAEVSASVPSKSPISFFNQDFDLGAPPGYTP